MQNKMNAVIVMTLVMNVLKQIKINVKEVTADALSISLRIWRIYLNITMFGAVCFCCLARPRPLRFRARARN